MGFRYRKGFGVAKLIKLNISKSGVSVSLGKKGFTYNIGRKGVRGTIGLPGSGLSYNDYQSYDDLKKDLRGTPDGVEPRKESKSHIVMWVILLIVIGFLIKTYFFP
ncbi:MAG TPA: DUF4236 domain-containing protein [Alphaproteobacteria bacterium]